MNFGLALAGIALRVQFCAGQRQGADAPLATQRLLLGAEPAAVGAAAHWRGYARTSPHACRARMPHQGSHPGLATAQALSSLLRASVSDQSAVRAPPWTGVSHGSASRRCGSTAAAYCTTSSSTRRTSSSCLLLPSPAFCCLPTPSHAFSRVLTPSQVRGRVQPIRLPGVRRGHVRTTRRVELLAGTR